MPQGAAADMSCLLINHQSIDTVIFDFDGTLAELNIDFDQMRREVTELVVRYGIDPLVLQHRHVLEVIEEAGELLLGRSRRQSLSFISEARGAIEKIEIEAARRGKLFDSTQNLLQTLRTQDIRTGIITRNCGQAVRTVFPDIADYCSVVVCRDDVGHVKPHPDHLGLALTKLGSKASRSIMIGDHPLDIEAGRNAGTLAAGVLSGHYREDDFIRAGADLILPQASEILKLLPQAPSRCHL